MALLRTKELVTICALFTFVAGCGDDGSSDADGGGTGNEGGEASSGDSGQSSGDEGTASESSGDTGADTEGEEEPCTFAECMDLDSSVVACDIWADDCPEGEKCTAWDSAGGGTWDANRCTALAAQPKQIGDVCAGNPLDGTDDCAKGLFCWVNSLGSPGNCVALCSGSQLSPVCDEGANCTIYNDGALPVCTQSCDPLLGDCPQGQVCGPDETNGAFSCVGDATGGAGNAGDPCQSANTCSNGHTCVVAGQLNGCTTGIGCCTEVCDTSAANSCGDSAHQCVTLFANPKPGFDKIGVCRIPD